MTEGVTVKSFLKYFSMAVKELHYERMFIKDVTRRHLSILLDHCGTLTKTWSAYTYNSYRKHLSSLYRVLIKEFVMDYNPVELIEKKKQVRKIRETLTKEQRKLIGEDLYRNKYTFWRFIQIFFHSGRRISEMLRVEPSQVFLEQQRFKVLSKKGNQQKEVWVMIKDVALPYWKEIMNESECYKYIFSTGLKPGDKLIRREQITKRWQIYVKKKFNITADVYSLKHSHTDEVAELLSLQEAQRHAGHTSERTTLLYAVNEAERQNERVKKLANEF